MDDYKQPPDYLTYPPQRRVVESDHRPRKAFAKPTTTSWEVPLQRDDLPKLVNGFYPPNQDYRYFVYTTDEEPLDGKDGQGEEEEGGDGYGLAKRLRVHVFRGLGWPIAEVVVEVPPSPPEDRAVPGEGGTRQVQDSDQNPRITQITYEASQERWDFEGLGLATLDTTKWFVAHVFCEWVFDAVFPEDMWTEIEERYKGEKERLFEYWDARDAAIVEAAEKQENERREKERIEKQKRKPGVPVKPAELRGRPV